MMIYVSTNSKKRETVERYQRLAHCTCGGREKAELLLMLAPDTSIDLI